MNRPPAFVDPRSALNGATVALQEAAPPAIPEPAPRVGTHASPRPPAPIEEPRPPDQPGLGRDLDYRAVRAIRDAVAAEVADTGRERDVAERHVRQWVDGQRRAGMHVGADVEQRMLTAVLADLFRLGRLAAILADAQVENIHIFGARRTRVTYADGHIENGPAIADTDGELLEIIQQIAERAGPTPRAITTTYPFLDIEMPDGSRLSAAYEVTPSSSDGDVSSIPVVQIRRHRIKDADLDDLVRLNMIDPLLRDFLEAAVRAKLNIMIAGQANAGKTTLLRALAKTIPGKDVIATLEESRELGLHELGAHEWVLSLETRQGHGDLQPNGRPRGEITASDLIPRILRMSANRIIVGEVRGAEVVAMLEAMTVAPGGMCTIHARAPHLVNDRIISLALQHGPDMTSEQAMRMAAQALDLIVYVALDDQSGVGGPVRRHVSHVVEIDGGFEGGRALQTMLFEPGPDGHAVPRHRPERTKPALLAAGYRADQLLASIDRSGGFR